MGKVVIIMAVVFTVIFATVTFTLKSRTQVIPDLLAEGMASDNAANLGAYALKYAIVRLQEADGSPKGTDTGEKITENTVMDYGTYFEVISEGYINSISWDFVEATDYTYPNGNSSQEPQQNGNGWGRNRYRWRGGNHASVTTPNTWNYALASTSLYLPVAKAGKGKGNSGNGNGNNGNGNGNNNSGGNNGNGNGNTGPGNQGNENPVGNAGGNGNGNGNNGNGNGNSGNGNGNNGNNNANTTPGIPRGNHHAWAWGYGWGNNGHAPAGVNGEAGDPYRIVHIVADVSWYTDGKLYTHEAEAVVELRDGGIEGEIAYWPFDEGSGSLVTDNSDIGNADGSLKNMNNSDWVEGTDGTALDFDGYNDYVQLGKDVDDNIEDALTVGAWIQANDPGWLDWGRIISSSHANGDQPDWYLRGRIRDIAIHMTVIDSWIPWRTHDEHIQLWKDVKYVFGIRNGNSSWSRYDEVSLMMDEMSNSSLDIFDWHYVAGRYDGNYSNSKAEIMVKVVDEDISNTKIVNKWISHGNDNVVTIGGVDSPVNFWLFNLLNSVRCFDGTIDEVRLLNRSATDAELVQMSETTAGGSGGSGSSINIVFWKD